MKVCIATLFSNEAGALGIQTHLKWLKRYFAENGIEYVCVSPRDCSKIIVYPVFALRYLLKNNFKALSVAWFRAWHYFFLEKALARTLGIQKIDVVNAQGPLEARAALKVRKSRGYKYKIILTLHMNLPSQADEESLAAHIKKDGWYYLRIKEREKAVFLGVDGIVFVSDYIRKAIMQAYPELKNMPQTVIYNGAGLPASASEEGANAPLRRRLINISSLEPRKNQVFLLQVVKKLERRVTGLELHLIGKGPDRRRLERLAGSLGLEGCVQFEGFVANAQGYLRGGDLYLHSALAESCPYALIEAMSRGIPAVSLSAGGVPELIRHGYNGFLVDHEDADAFAAYIEELLTDSEKYKLMSANCVRQFKEKFHYQAMGNSFIKFYNTN